MKMRVLYLTGKKKLINIAELITNNYATEKVNCMDKIPPAYSCDKVAQNRTNIKMSLISLVPGMNRHECRSQ